MGTDFFPKSPLSLGSRSLIGGEMARYRPASTPDVSCHRDMPNRDSEKVKEAKKRWYLKHREEIVKRKREQRAAKKKLKPPKPPKPPPTPEEIARARELNRLACSRYRATHGDRVRALNRKYYHRHRDQIIQQQRDRRARARETPNPFSKLRALADVCAARVLELEHGYTRIVPAPQKKTGSREKQATTKTVSAAPVCSSEWDRGGEGHAPSTLS